MCERKRTEKIIVNGLSVSRIIGTMLMPLFLNYTSIPVFIGYLAFLFLTDFLDGRFARLWHVQTKGGSLLDPLGDKVLAIACLIALTNSHHLLLIALVLEILITMINVERTLHGEVVKSTIMGKIKTAVLSVTLVLAAVHALNPDVLSIIASELFNITEMNLTITAQVVAIASSITIDAQILTVASYIADSVRQKDIRTKNWIELKPWKELFTRLFDETKFEEDKNTPLLTIIRK